MTRHGLGRPYRRSSDGRWIGKVPDGRGGHRYVTGTDEATVARRLREMRRSLAPTTSSSRRAIGERLRDHLERWFVEVAPHRYRGRTATMNLHQARLHILPVIGRYRLPDLRPSDVQRMLDRMTERGYAPQTVRNVGHILSVVLRQAERDGLVERNVARLVDMPRRTAERLPSLSTSEVSRFLATVREDLLWPAWALAFATGMRVGEVVGLRWSDWDRASGTLMVDGQWQRIEEAGRVRYTRRPGKTANARRLLYLPALGTEALTAQLAQARSAKVVFANGRGHPLAPTYVSRRFRESLAAHGFAHVRLHSLRHAAAVAMLDASGGDVVAVSKALGHGTLAVTVDFYGREADDARRRAARAMDLALEANG